MNHSFQDQINIIKNYSALLDDTIRENIITNFNSQIIGDIENPHQKMKKIEVFKKENEDIFGSVPKEDLVAAFAFLIDHIDMTQKQIEEQLSTALTIPQASTYKEPEKVNPGYLLEDTPEAEEMRQNIIKLLQSDDEVNIKLALHLMKGGGLFEGNAKLENNIETFYQGNHSIIIDMLKYYSTIKNQGKGLRNKIKIFLRLGTRDIKLTLLEAFFERVKLLDFSLNKIKTLPKEIGELKNLQKLNLSCIGLQVFPKEILQLKNLQRLSLMSNEIEIFPKEIGKLEKLQKLDFSGNKIKTLPKEIGELKCLERLDLSSTGLQVLPKEISQLTNLLGLNLVGNEFEIFPTEILQITNLSFLYFQSNNIPQEEQEKIRNLLPNCTIHF